MTFQIIVRMLPIRLKYHCKTIFEFDTQKYLFFHTYQLNKILKYIYISLYSYHFLSLFLKFLQKINTMIMQFRSMFLYYITFR